MSKFEGKGRFFNGKFGGGIFSIQFKDGEPWYTADVDPYINSFQQIKRFRQNLDWAHLYHALKKAGVTFEQITLEDFQQRQKDQREKNRSNMKEWYDEWIKTQD